MPSTFAYAALFIWPLVVFLLFRSLPRPQALIWSILGGYLLLPYAVAAVKIPAMPTFNKDLIPVLAAAVMCLMMPDGGALVQRRGAAPGAASGAAPGAPSGLISAEPVPPGATERAVFTRQREVRQGRSGTSAVNTPARSTSSPGSGRIGNLLIAITLISPVLTALQNTDPVRAGQRIIPALRLYDAGSMISGLIVTLLPFLLARRYLAAPDRHATLLRILCVCGLLYSLPALFEVRMSPQLSRWLYGFLAQSFAQTMREGGFRPVVFLQHGLWLAIFFAMAILAALALWRRGSSGRKTSWLLAGLYLLGVLILCKSLGALAITLVLAPAVLLFNVRWQMITAAIFAAIILTYPMLRGANLIPMDRIYAIAASISEDRAQSLEFRFDNEDLLLAHANEKPLSGWGGWGRARVYDPGSGKDVSVTDGAWIIIAGGFGWLGYIGQFGLLAAPILLLAQRRRSLNLSIATSSLCLVLSANLIDLIPNGTLTPVTWLIAGALMGRYSFAGSIEEGDVAATQARVHGPIPTSAGMVRRSLG